MVRAAGFIPAVRPHGGDKRHRSLRFTLVFARVQWDNL
jgi:hypothetical protein